MTTNGHLSPPMTPFHNWPGSPPSDSSASVRSCSSIGGLSSSSSLASTFSDISSTGAKTHAFFASPFTQADMPSSSETNSTSTPTQPRSITADFFSTPVRSPSPPRSTTKTSSLLAAIHPSRIFPSRYTSRSPRDDEEGEEQVRKPRPEFLFLDLSRDEHDHNNNNFSLLHSPHTRDLSSLSSTSTTSSSSSSVRSSLALPEPTNPHRLPTPPPPSPFSSSHALYLPVDSTNEPTPRPPHLETRYTKADHDGHDEIDDHIQAHVEPVPGCIITSNPPCMSHPKPASPTLTVTPPPDSTTFETATSVTSTSFTPPPTLLEPQPNSTILYLTRPLGQGAFSSVWLAEDKSRIPLTIRSKKSIRELRKKASMVNLSRSSSIRSGFPLTTSSNSSVVSLSRKSSLEEKPTERRGSFQMRRLRAKVPGTRPVGFDTHFVDERHGKMGMGVMGSDRVDLGSSSGQGDGAVSRAGSKKGRLVAVKMTPRRAISGLPTTTKSTKREEEERTRVGFVREVEILKHISHPNITVLLEHLSTASHHILVLPYLPGGDLLGLVNSDIAWSKLGENVLRRIWCELCKAVGWMHGVGLVHRDIKLENILLTTPVFSSLTPDTPRPTLETLPLPPSPLIKLTDFGLSRFIEIDESTGESELLSTRCGSEAYAAPELVMGTGSARVRTAAGHESGGVRGFYDARETDAWACGVVLYALVGRRLPFGEGVGAIQDGHREQGRIGGDGAPGYGYGYGGAAERRQWLMRIARGEYEWPSPPSPPLTSDVNVNSNSENGELMGASLVTSEGVKRIVGKLLVRDPRKRARIMDLWDDKWMWGRGGSLAVGMTQEEWREREQEREREREKGREMIGLGIDFGDAELQTQMEPEGSIESATIDVELSDEGSRDNDGGEGDEGDDVADGEEGWLLDQEGIANVARQEVV